MLDDIVQGSLQHLRAAPWSSASPCSTAVSSRAHRLDVVDDGSVQCSISCVSSVPMPRRARLRAESSPPPPPPRGTPSLVAFLSATGDGGSGRPMLPPVGVTPRLDGAAGGVLVATDVAKRCSAPRSSSDRSRRPPPTVAWRTASIALAGSSDGCEWMRKAAATRAEAPMPEEQQTTAGVWLSRKLMHASSCSLRELVGVTMAVM
mmetsp:Transcript_23807/g.58928  ORF Transcript_23807/g.58928 Transcript_23807/m.58928 type:complete len:205 (-) Transcript_23807:528-1142(-)